MRKWSWFVSVQGFYLEHNPLSQNSEIRILKITTLFNYLSLSLSLPILRLQTKQQTVKRTKKWNTGSEFLSIFHQRLNLSVAEQMHLNKQRKGPTWILQCSDFHTEQQIWYLSTTPEVSLICSAEILKSDRWVTQTISTAQPCNRLYYLTRSKQTHTIVIGRQWNEIRYFVGITQVWGSLVQIL